MEQIEGGVRVIHAVFARTPVLLLGAHDGTHRPQDLNPLVVLSAESFANALQVMVTQLGTIQELLERLVAAKK